MTKQILSAAVIATLTFAGCSQVSDTVTSAAKGTANMAKSATEKVTSTVSDAVDSNATAVEANATTTVSNVSEESLKVGDVVETKIEAEAPAAALPTSSSMTDMATDKAVEVADEKTDGAASQVVDALK